MTKLQTSFNSVIAIVSANVALTAVSKQRTDKNKLTNT